MRSEDYERFQLGMHLSNHTDPVVIRDILETKKYREPFSGYPADKSLVDVLAYTLMPNHFHLVLRQKAEEGITRFMKKLAGGYSMYFNLKYEHSGTLFQGPFKSKHINSDPYFKWIFAYVHLNPTVFVESGAKENAMQNQAATWKYLMEFPYSSFCDFYSVERPERRILAYEDSLHHIDGMRDMKGLVRAYRKGKVLFDNPEENPENRSPGS